MVAEHLTGAMMLPGPCRLLLGLLMALQLLVDVNVEHYTKKGSCQCSQQAHPGEKMKCVGSGNSNSSSQCAGVAGNCTAHGCWLGDVDGQLWGEDLCPVVQGHWGKLQYGLCVDGALSACDRLVCGDAGDYRYLKEMSDGAPVVWKMLDEPADLGGCRQNKLAEMNSLDYETELNATQVMEYESNGGGALATMNRCFLYILDFVDSDYEQLLLYLEDFDFVMEVEIAVRNLFSFMRHVMELMSVERAWMCWLITMMSLLVGSHLGLSRWFEDGMVGTSRSSTSSLTRTTRNRMRVRRAQWKMQLKAMLFASWIPGCQGMEGATTGESAFLQQMSNLATAATSAANAAEKAIGLLSQSAASSSSGDQGGLQAASRILKCPDAYNGEDPMAFSSWKFTFCSWLSFGDPRFQRYFDRIDKSGASEDLPEYAAVDQELSVKLFAILTSYLKGRCTSLVKSMARSKDGFRLWRALQQEYEPSSRQRSLAIAQTLSNFPAFSGSKTLHEHILAYEQLVAQFEEVSSSSYPSELKIATLVRCSNQKLREHLQLTIGEQTTYAQLKETMLGYDKACRSWTPETILKSIQQQNTPSGDQGEYGQAQQTVYVAAGGQGGQVGGQQQQARGSPASSYPPSSTAASTVRRIYTIPFGIPSLSSSSSSSVRMVSAGDDGMQDVVILDSGSDVSLLPLAFGNVGEESLDHDSVQLRDCQGEKLEVTGYRTVSLVVTDSDGGEAELQHPFLIANVQSCILSLGQLYQGGWSVQQNSGGPCLESPDQTLRVPVFYKRNSLAIKASVCRVECMEDGDAMSPHAYVRAIVELEEKFRPEDVRNNHWQVADGNPFMRSVGRNFIDPRPVWAGNFGFRTTLVQRRSTAAEDHGWFVVEVSQRYLELEDPFGPIPGLESYSPDEDVIVLTILAERDECLAHFGGLLDWMQVEWSLKNLTNLSRHTEELAPALRADAESDVILVNDVEITPNSSVEFQDAPAQPTVQERKLHEVTHVPFKPWCAACVQSKSRPNHQRPTPPDEMSQRTYPTIQCDFYVVSGNLNVLIMVDVWTKYVGVEPLRNKLQSVVGAAVAKFLGELGYYDKVELAFDNEPVLAAGMRVAQNIRAAQGLVTVLQPGQMYGKARTALAERSIQTVRAQGKCLMTFLEEKMRVCFPPDHVLRGWSVLHGAWLLNRYHVSSSTGTTAFMALRGRPYRGRICAFGEEVYALDPLQAKYAAQWRRGIWLSKDSADMDLVAVSPTEIIRSRAVRKVSEHWNSELAVALEVGPWDMRRGINAEVKVAKPAEVPLPLLHPPIGGVEPEIEDEDAKAVREYARDHPQEDVDEGEVEVQPLDFEEGGASVMVSDEVQSDQKMDAEQEAREKRAPGDLRLPVPVRRSRSLKTWTLYSPVYAGNMADSPGTASSSRHVRRVIEELEMVDDDEMDYAVPDEAWDWEVCDSVDGGVGKMASISAEEMARRGFHNEGAGPPEVTQEELDWLDQEAMKMELKRLKELHVIDNVSDDVVVENCVRLDTRLVRDWRYREGQWRRRARLVARGFRDGDCSHIDTFSPTTPLPIVKLLIILSMLYDLAICSLDVGDAFLQVNVQQLLSGINSLWKYVHDMDSTISKEFILGFHGELSKELKLKIEGPLQCGDEGSIYYLKRELQFTEHGIYVAPSSRYIPRLLEILKIKDRRGRTVPHHGCLEIFDAASIADDEFLNGDEAKVFRSALGICIYLSQERCDIQHPVRILASYMARPTKTAMSAVKKLGSYLMWTKEMKLYYGKAELYQSVMQRWFGGQQRLESKPFMLELFSDSDWATCKTSRRSTSSGLIFLNSCLIHSHSRAQNSVSLSSMEAEILAATGLLVEGIYIKQVLQFLVDDNGGLGSQNKVMMRLRLDSTSAQAFFSRLGPGKAKHLATRLLWTQQALRRSWFCVDRIATRENPADLNTKALSKERRTFLMRRIGLECDVFEDEDEVLPGQSRKKQLVKLLVNMVMASNLQGCSTTLNSTTRSLVDGWSTASWAWTFAMMVIILLVIVVLRLVYKMTLLMEELKKYKEVWKTIRGVANLTNNEDPFCAEGDVELGEGPEEESPEVDAEDTASEQAEPGINGAMVENDNDAMSEVDGEFESLRRRPLRHEADHGSANGGDFLHPGADHDEGDENVEEKSFAEEDESPRARYDRYRQSTMEEVSDPDEWTNIHYGFAPDDSDADAAGSGELPISRSRSRERLEGQVPEPKTMPKPLAKSVARRVAMDKAMEMLEEKDFSGGATSTTSAPSAGVLTETNYFLSSVPMASFFNISPVPREALALDDYRWDLLMQGVGPEDLVVHNCRRLSNEIDEEPNHMRQYGMRRLLRNLQNLLVLFQSGRPERWMEAADRVMDRCNHDGAMDFFDLAETEAGSPRSNHEGEHGEEETLSDDPSQPGDRDDLGDYDGSSGDHRGRVAERAAAAAGLRSSSAV
ncbi:unnamed protein product [Cladocopium goreaui]|uniref:Retrovirus-related Pol polyprotein from transposon TNT 1-94 n=1 Tax=Cladocopium goreaui TaxID=2562237 RepID=A0A9P1FVZ1_9DINO|nr:unnamed protein product [Cladocopium goreaui]